MAASRSLMPLSTIKPNKRSELSFQLTQEDRNPKQMSFRISAFKMMAPSFGIRVAATYILCPLVILANSRSQKKRLSVIMKQTIQLSSLRGLLILIKPRLQMHSIHYFIACINFHKTRQLSTQRAINPSTLLKTQHLVCLIECLSCHYGKLANMRSSRHQKSSNLKTLMK